RLAHAVEKLHGIFDPILDNPLDLDDVEVARQHQRLVRDVVREPRPWGRRVLGTEAELLFQDALGGDGLHAVDAERQLEVQARIGDAAHFAEALDDCPLLGLHRIKGAQDAPDDEQYAESNQHGRGPEARHAAARRAAGAATAAAVRPAPA